MLAGRASDEGSSPSLARPANIQAAEDETRPAKDGKERIMILGGGPNRIGQGIEFDYCCCHAAFALKEAGYETIMVNSNPETVSNCRVQSAEVRVESEEASMSLFSF